MLMTECEMLQENNKENNLVNMKWYFSELCYGLLPGPYMVHGKCWLNECTNE